MSGLGKQYTIRPYQESDKAFIMATMLRGLYYGNSWFSMIPKDIFMNNYKKVIEALITRNLVTIACLPDEPDVILGYSLVNGDFSKLHWVYVKQDFRKMGIGKSLVPETVKVVTHMSEQGKLIKDSKHLTWIFNPFAI